MLLWRPRSRQEDSKEVDLKKPGREDVIQLAQDWVRLRFLVNTLMNFRVTEKMDSFLIRLAIINYWRSLRHAASSRRSWPWNVSEKIGVETIQNIPVSNIFIATTEQFRLAQRHVGKVSHDSA